MVKTHLRFVTVAITKLTVQSLGAKPPTRLREDNQRFFDLISVFGINTIGEFVCRGPILES
jgi:hypothetical protein